jgi:hypothetical protein
MSDLASGKPCQRRDHPCCRGGIRTRRDLWLDRMPMQPQRGRASGHALDPRGIRKDGGD